MFGSTKHDNTVRLHRRHCVLHGPDHRAQVVSQALAGTLQDFKLE